MSFPSSFFILKKKALANPIFLYLVYMFIWNNYEYILSFTYKREATSKKKVPKITKNINRHTHIGWNESKWKLIFKKIKFYSFKKWEIKFYIY